MITIKTPEEISTLREGGRRLAEILQKVAGEAKAEASAYDLDGLAEDLIFELGGRPSFKGYRGKGEQNVYPAALCVSVNNEVVHGLPLRTKIFKEGDIVGLDIGMWWPRDSKNQRSLCTDLAVTVGVGKISAEAQKLLRGVKEALDIGLKTVRPGRKIGDISFAIQNHLEKYNLGIIKNLAGHGVGYEVHEEPLIPNYGKAGEGIELKEGMVLAIEPMATFGDWKVKIGSDGWAYETADGSLAAHFEHTVVVVEDGVEILTKTG